MPHDMIDEYFKFYTESVKQYGEKTCVMYACGSFYEVYKIENNQENIGNADKISEIIRCEFSNKNKSKRSENGSSRAFPDFCGFGIAYLPKYLTPLLEHNYTVVIVDQLENKSKGKLVKRGIVAVHSPCLKGCDFETYMDTESNLIGVFLDIIKCNPKLSGSLSTMNTLIYSVCCINNTTNEIEITENSIQFRPNEFQIGLDELNRVLLRYNIKEMRVNTLNTYDYNKVIKKYLDEISDYNNFNYKINILEDDDSIYLQYLKSNFQNEYFRRIYKHLDFGLLNPIEYINLSDKQLSIINFMYTLDFMAAHDTKYINNLSPPKIVEESNNLTLELNTLSQLSILPNSTNSHHNRISSVFDVINHTSTAIGRRHLKSILTKPFKDINTIQTRYNLSDDFSQMDKTNVSFIEKILDKILDFERLHRKMGLDSLHPYEFEKLHLTYMKILELITTLMESKSYLKSQIPNDDILLQLNNYINDYKTSFNLNEMKRISLNTNREEMCNFFNKGIVLELDKIQNDIELSEENIEKLRKSYDNIINEKSTAVQMIKLAFTDNDGYYFTCTKIRYQKLVKECKERCKRECNDKCERQCNEFTMKSTSNMCKFFTPELNKLSNHLINTRDLLVKKVKLHYILKLSTYYNTYNTVFTHLLKFIEIIDVSLSNFKCAKKNKYCKPNIVDNSSSSFLNATELRHPIIELINNETEYVPNDVSLDDNNLGLLLYGLNSSGKSSLLRAVGICIILAQCGLYVPCKNLIYSPFNTIISQVDLTDNLFSGKSSFISEMCGLKKILNCTGENTLILSDELCRGTEINSSAAIVSSTIIKLIKSNSKFFFTTHLHELPKIKQLSNEQRLSICHLSVNTSTEHIIFERHMKKGSGSDLYGLEVCKSIIQDNDFIDIAFEIRNQITCNKTSILSSKKSRYNTKKIIDHCQVCNYTPLDKNSIPLDTHHINEQQNCDDSGFVNNKHFHKNRSFNLVTLCKDCHRKIDSDELIIRGYKSGTSGIFLDYYNIPII